MECRSRIRALIALGPALALSWFVAIGQLSAVAEAGTLHVCPSCGFHRIRDAIDVAHPGDRIEVGEGSYPEGELRITKPLHLVAEGTPEKTVIDGQGKGNVILIERVRGSEVRGFTIRNSGKSYVNDLAGIKIMDSIDCKITNNRLSGNSFGIYLGRTKDCQVEENRIEGSRLRESQMGDGIHVWNANGILVQNNETSGNRDGIYFEFVNDSRIYGNRSTYNVRYGLHFMYSNRDEYRDNLFSDNDSGVAVMYSHEIRMFHNTFENSLGPASYGILLKEISASDIRLNSFNHNTIGAYLEGTTRSFLIENRFYANGWAVRILGNSDSNVFTLNQFISNSFDLTTNASLNMNQFERNYWSAYKGIDLNHDGVGDTPYYPLRLSSYLMEKSGVFSLLLRSFFFSALDEAENVIPALTPESFRDDHPLMQETLTQ